MFFSELDSVVSKQTGLPPLLTVLLGRDVCLLTSECKVIAMPVTGDKHGLRSRGRTQLTGVASCHLNREWGRSQQRLGQRLGALQTPLR